MRIARTLAFVALLALPATAQEPSSVSGRLTAEGRGPVAGAVVRLVEDGGGREMALETDARGRFARVGVPPGRYRATIEREGFAPVDVLGIDVRVSDRVRLYVEMTPFDEAPFKRQTIRYRRPAVNVEDAALKTRVQ